MSEYRELTERLHLRSWPGGIDRYILWCPGCEEPHTIPVRAGPDQPEVKTWQFDGNLAKPTFTPSMNLQIPHSRRCHFNVVGGRIIYDKDCHHELSGKTIDMVPIPD